MKLAMTRMSTAFSYLDLNVHKAVANLDDPAGSAYAVRKYIQSAVSLTEEDKRNCTKIIPAVNAGVTFTEKHAEKFDTSFRYDVCKAGEARISDPRNLYGTDSPATRRRVAVFAWLVEHNGECLAHPGTGSVDELSRAHRDLLLGPNLIALLAT
ncbi:hypothetical protein LTR91_003177 [Friedmanniomyces endolithicus]|uniref:Uncharacterized protein n=1 Tax=Friedmanniomyces endolithicus TaxID=329885 RepID=A0AAN6KWR7_9PEZI|nr:hypothetical protein LTR35_011712 [Friedmanniomyces endolithicus]KAK0311735.1 hypothetical protein LTR82_014107 [Friedmanniomyces endolithicus]KAK0910978.1 hypothetical protein LTR57_015612 [Friedmanniomyces endolithicus]KAK0983589.1 hypothetical protein LTR54_014254 [Friedmanniomyces endolithicus]KAK1008109.1 hypothetical protein LTR91_003177 [Friedmanniomyces endolithicus]